MEKVELNNNIEICLVNLGNTCKYEYYTVRNTDDLKEAYKDFRYRFNADEIEIQGISHSQYISSILSVIYCE